MGKNQKFVQKQIILEKQRVNNLQKETPFRFNSNKEIKYTKKFPDNKSVFYYPLKKNFMSNEEEKKYNHYYGEEFIDRVSRIDRSNKKETYIPDDLISNLIFIYLLISKSNERELIPKIKTVLKIKSCTRMAIIKRIKILYDRYHGYLDEEKSDKQFWYMSCKTHEKKNILTLFQNNKQLYCNIDNIYDCSFHSNIDPNFDNPSSYDQIKYLKSYKKLIEFSLYTLFGNNTNNLINNQESNDMIIEEQSDNEANEEKKEIKNNNMNNNNINNNDLISNASSKMLSVSNSKETEEIVSEIIIENMDGTNKIIYLNKKKDLENLKNINEPFKNHITDLTYEFNHILKHIRCQNNMVPQIKKIKGIEKEDKKPCSELCYKNFLNCDEKLHDETYSALKDKKFPDIYELLLNKFLLILKFDPCHIYKLMKVFLKDIPNFKLNCTDIYLHLLSKKFSLKKIIKKELFDLNIKERELSKKNKASLTPAQSKKIEENNLKNLNLNYVPCIHFGNEICDDKCLCSKRGFCEVFCRCNKILCKSAFHGCHCFKGDCTSNHCPCFIYGRECNPQRCKNCNIQKSEDIRCKNLKLQMDFETKLIVGISQISGWGLFSNEYIKKDSLIGEYKGELITDEVVNKRDKFREYENCTYMFKLDDEYTIDSRKMGNLLRYANHSKANSNSYTKIVFSEGQRKIVLIAKRDIFKGEEILFDYDGQGILGKQFSWINDEKKIPVNNYNKEKNINNHKNNNPVKKEIIQKKPHLHSAIKSTSNPIIIEDNDDESKINNDKNEIVINNPYFKNLFNSDKNINKNIEPQKEQIIIQNNDKNIINNKIKDKKDDSEKKEIKNINISNKSLSNEKQKKEEKFLEISDINNKNINININNSNSINNINNDINLQKNNLIDLLSEGKINSKINNNNINKNANNNPKVLFKTEEDDIITIRDKYQKGKEHNNVFDLMFKIGENLEKNNKFIGKKRNNTKTSENQNDENNINNNANINNNIENPNISSLKQVLINDENEQKLDLEANNSKLRKPIFAGENMEDSDENISDNKNKNKVGQKNYYFNSKIRYNFITCQNINIIDPTKNNQENKINNVINNSSIFPSNIYPDNKNSNLNNFNINLSANKTNFLDKELNPKIFNYFHIGTIRIILELDNNPILNDFKFFSATNSAILKNVESIKCKMEKLSDLNVDVDLEKDVYGYLVNNINNKGFRIFNDYLNFFDNTCYHCHEPNINADIYIVSNGTLFNNIKERVELKNSKIKKLLFFIKKNE